MGTKADRNTGTLSSTTPGVINGILCCFDIFIDGFLNEKFITDYKSTLAKNVKKCARNVHEK